MYNQQFWTKYLFRLAHIGTVVFLGGRVILNYLYPCTDEQLSVGQKIAFGVSGLILIISGFVNIFLLKGKDNLKENYKLWVGLLHFKLLTTILVLTPLFNIIARSISPDFPIAAFQFWFVIAWIVISPFLRFYRELWTQYHREKQQFKD